MISHGRDGSVVVTVRWTESPWDLCAEILK